MQEPLFLRGCNCVRKTGYPKYAVPKSHKAQDSQKCDCVEEFENEDSDLSFVERSWVPGDCSRFVGLQGPSQGGWGGAKHVEPRTKSQSSFMILDLNNAPPPESLATPLVGLPYRCWKLLVSCRARWPQFEHWSGSLRGLGGFGCPVAAGMPRLLLGGPRNLRRPVQRRHSSTVVWLLPCDRVSSRRLSFEG